MTPEALKYAQEHDLKVRTINHDYTFVGWVVSIYHKYQAPDKVRVVIESGEGINLIQSPKNLEFDKFLDALDYDLSGQP